MTRDAPVGGQRAGAGAPPAGGVLLDGTPVVRWLVEVGVLDEPTAAALAADPALLVVRPLTGGVSSLVLAVDLGNRQWVLKQALSRLLVTAEWTADPRRLLVEATGLRFAAAVTPDRVPAVVHVDPVRLVLLEQRVPAHGDWRARLLRTDADGGDQQTARTLGTLLARWHAAGRSRPPGSPAAALDGGPELLDQLRVTPFHREVAARLPQVAADVHRLGDQLLAAAAGEDAAAGPAGRTVVHGDFSPKNVLTGPGRSVHVLDFEVAHVGAAVFDLAFLLAHLLVKSVHRASAAAGLRACAGAFLDGYGGPAALRGVGGSGLLREHLGALVLARTHGRSPAGYLDAAAAEVAARIGIRLVLGGTGATSAPDTGRWVAEVWSIVEEER